MKMNSKQKLFEMMEKVNPDFKKLNEEIKSPFRKLVVDIDNDEGFLITDENKYNNLVKYGKINKSDEPYNVFGFLWYEWLEIPQNIAQTI